MRRVSGSVRTPKSFMVSPFVGSAIASRLARRFRGTVVGFQGGFERIEARVPELLVVAHPFGASMQGLRVEAAQVSATQYLALHDLRAAPGDLPQVRHGQSGVPR